LSKRSIGMLAGAIAFGLAVVGFCAIEAASAGPTSVNQPVAAQTSQSVPFELVHGCHRDVQWDRGGEHYHIGADCRRVQLRSTPPPREYYERRERRPVCHEVCHYFGPIKTCKTECD
jgi:hypothetical protein